MSGSRTETSEYADPLVVEMGERRRRNLFGARNVLSLLALLGLCMASTSLAAGAAPGIWTPWRSEVDERSYLFATICLQAAMTISGMLVAHTVLSQPPRVGPRILAGRIGTYFITLILTAGVLVVAELLSDGPLPVPRLLVAMIAVYPVCIAVIDLLLAPLLLRQWAWVIAFAALTVWMVVALAAGTTQVSAPTTFMVVLSGVEFLSDAATVNSILTLGTCFWAGAAVACLGNLVDSHGPVVRTIVPPVAALGTLIFLPQILTGASVGHIMLATALAPLVDVDQPRWLTEIDVGFGLLTIGWVAGVVGSLLVVGRITPWGTALSALVIGGGLSVLIGFLVGRPWGSGTSSGPHKAASALSGRGRRRREATRRGRALRPGEHTGFPDSRRRLVVDQGQTYWEDRAQADDEPGAR